MILVYRTFSNFYRLFFFVRFEIWLRTIAFVFFKKHLLFSFELLFFLELLLLFDEQECKDVCKHFFKIWLVKYIDNLWVLIIFVQCSVSMLSVDDLVMKLKDCFGINHFSFQLWKFLAFDDFLNLCIFFENAFYSFRVYLFKDQYEVILSWLDLPLFD